MKKISILSIFFAVLMFGCEEIVPPIDSEIRYTGRRIIIEEFTGVQCVNCPVGSKKLQELSDLHGEFVIPISIHAGSFSEPYPQSTYDFTTSEGDNLEGSLLGPVQGFPSAVVNRRLFDNEDELPITINKWAGYVIQELLQQPLLQLDISNSYNETTRNLETTIDLKFLEDVTEGLGITIMILEDDIEDYQLTPDTDLNPPDGKDPDYKHKHVLRTMLTDYSGDVISSSQTTQGSTPSFTYNFTIPNDWVANKCEVVAFVSRKGGDSLDVLQANQEDIVN
ncbi:MAG: Omp28-related outer membrane protein [Saprospiraceae bacterium]